MTKPKGDGKIHRDGAEAVFARSLHVLLVAIAYTIVSVLPLFLATSQSTRLQSELGFGAGGFGAAVSIAFAAAMLTATPIGLLVSRAGASVGFKLSAVCGAASLLWLGLVATNWTGMAVGLALYGIAASFSQVTASIVLASGVDRRYQGRAFGIKQAAVPVTSLVGGVLASSVGLWLGWRPIFTAAGVAVALLVFWRPSIDVDRTGRASASGGGRWLRYAPFAAVGVLTGAVGMFLATFAVDSAVTFDFSEGSAGLLLAMGSGGAALIRVTIGQAVDRRRGNGLRELAFLTIATVCCLTVMALFNGNKPLFGIGLVAAIGFGWGTHGLIPHIGARISLADTGLVMGIATSSVYLGNVLGPLVTGFMIEDSYMAAWFFIGALCLTSVSIMYGMERRWSRAGRSNSD